MIDIPASDRSAYKDFYGMEVQGNRYYSRSTNVVYYTKLRVDVQSKVCFGSIREMELEMPAKGNSFTTSYLKLIFNATGIPNIADNASSLPLTNLYVSLHTSDPTVGGNQNSSEILYTGYARVAVARSASGFAVSGSTVNPVATISFPQMTGGSGGTVTNFAIGTAATGSGQILYTGTVTPNIIVANGVTPQLTTASSVTES